MAASPEHRARVLAAALLAATLAAYSPVFSNGFISLDDNQYLTENPRVQAGLTWTGIRWAFTTGHAANWHPLTWLSHMLDWELWGASAGGHHAVSLLLHAAASALLFHVLRRMTADPWKSAFVAAVFALHTLHVESVAWAAERKDVLGAFFWMLTLLAWLRWVERPGPGRYAQVLLAFALGLLSKPMLVTLPFALLLLDHWPLGRLGRGTVAARVLEKLPLLALTAVSSVVTFLVQRAQGAMAVDATVPHGLRLQNAVVSCLAYLGDGIWPAHPVAFRPHTLTPFPWPVLLGSAAALLVLTVLAVAWARRRPWLATGWFWYLGTLVPVIGLVQVGSQARADRYTYIPFVGAAIVVAWAAGEVATRWRALRVPLLAAGLAVCAAWTAATFVHARRWKDDRSLWTPIAFGGGGNYLALGILGNVELREGRPREAAALYERALEANPAYPQGHCNLGIALELMGRREEALERYRESLRRMPRLAEGHFNLARLLEATDLAAAERHYRAALAELPDFVEAHLNLGSVLRRMGRTGEAQEHLRRAAELRPPG